MWGTRLGATDRLCETLVSWRLLVGGLSPWLSHRSYSTTSEEPPLSNFNNYRGIPGKAVENERKHGISFDEGKTVFLDPFAETFDDPDHSTDERRFITIGMSTQQRLLFVAHVDRGVDRIRIISARVATRGESHAHQSAVPSNNDDLRPEYDLTQLKGGVRGKYYEGATAGTTLVLLERDVAEAFPDGQTVNQALRALIKVARSQVRPTGSRAKLANTALQPTSRARKSRPKARKRTRAARG